MPQKAVLVMAALRRTSYQLPSLAGLLNSAVKRRSSTVSKPYDVVVVGGGIMGSSISYFLKRKDPTCSVCVVERDCTYKQAATTLSVASIRQQFSTAENILMSMWSFEFLSNVQHHLYVLGNDPPDIQLQRKAYMFLASENGVDILKENHKLQRELGAKVELLEPDDLKSEFKWLNTDGIQLGCIGRDKEGWFDPWLLLTAFKKKAVNMGVDYINGTAVNIQCDNKGIVSSVKVIREEAKEVLETLPCGNLVCAAGPWAGFFVQCLGIDLPVAPRKRFVYVIDCPREPARNMPLLIDPSGVYVRPEGSASLFLCGQSPAEDAEPDPSNLEVDYNFFEDSVWPVLALRVPAFEALKVRHSWAGFYDYNLFDQNAIVGPHPDVKNLFFANGFSGHGIQQSPAVGDAVSELILHNCYGAIDLTRFSFDRIQRKNALKERNVV